MKMVRTSSALSSNRSLLVLLVLVFALLAVAAGRTVVGGSFGSSSPVYAPVQNPASVAPAVEAPSVPVTAAPVPAETAIPRGNPAVSAPASIYPGAPNAAPAATAVPRPTVPIGPATTAAPGRDIHSIAPEDAAAGFSPPSNRE